MEDEMQELSIVELGLVNGGDGDLSQPIVTEVDPMVYGNILEGVGAGLGVGAAALGAAAIAAPVLVVPAAVYATAAAVAVATGWGLNHSGLF
jgi:hypothetical protein